MRNKLGKFLASFADVAAAICKLLITRTKHSDQQKMYTSITGPLSVILFFIVPSGVKH